MLDESENVAEVAPPPPAIRVQGLVRSFGEKAVLKGMSFDVPRGCVFGYIGSNGAGKSTTVRILAGLDDDFEGRVEVSGMEVRIDPREIKRRVGYVPENAALFDGLTAIEFLELVGRLRDLEEGELASRAEALLEAFGLADRANSTLGGFSKGMRQKVLLSSALLHDPEILFLDEPLSGLDVSSTILVKELISALSKRGTTVFYCSHMMDVVERVCDRIVILRDGQIAADGSFEELSRVQGDRSLEEVVRRLTASADHEDAVHKIIEVIGEARK